jgi:hypothetical protein
MYNGSRDHGGEPTHSELSRIVGESNMAAPKPHYSREEFAQRGDAIYERDIEPRLETEDPGKFVAIDIETGAYELDRDELAAMNRLLARLPEAQVWLRRVGSRYAHRIGSCHHLGRK